MCPHYCADHRHWTDGPCEAGKHPLTRYDLTRRVAEIDNQLGDDETAQSNGYYVNKALQGERAQLAVLLEAIH